MSSPSRSSRSPAAPGPRRSLPPLYGIARAATAARPAVIRPSHRGVSTRRGTRRGVPRRGRARHRVIRSRGRCRPICILPGDRSCLEREQGNLDHAPSRRAFVRTATATAVAGLLRRLRDGRDAAGGAGGADQGGARPDDGGPDHRQVEGGQRPLPRRAEDPARLPGGAARDGVRAVSRRRAAQLHRLARAGGDPLQPRHGRCLQRPRRGQHREPRHPRQHGVHHQARGRQGGAGDGALGLWRGGGGHRATPSSAISRSCWRESSRPCGATTYTGVRSAENAGVRRPRWRGRTSS